MKKYIFSIIMLLSMTLLINKTNCDCPFNRMAAAESAESADEMSETQMPMISDEDEDDDDNEDEGIEEEVEVEVEK